MIEMYHVGIAGTGFIVEWFLSAVKDNEGIECKAIFSRSKDKAAKIADKFGIEKIYCDYDEMLKDENIDVIYVGNTNSLHYDFALKALLNDKHVICEKPFTSNTKELKHLVQIAISKKRYLFEAIVTSFMPNYQTLKQQIDKLGVIKMVQCNFSQYSSKYNRYLAGEQVNVFDLAYSGGALADISIYNLHFVMGLFGKPLNQHYYCNRGKNGIDTSGVSILEYDGFIAVCVGCKDSKSKCIAQIQGEKGYAYLMSETSRCANLKVVVGSEEEDLTIPQKDIALYYEVQEFVKIMNNDDYDKCIERMKYSLDVMDVYEKLRKSANIIFKADEAND